jgi:hypothetical protein
MYKLQSGSHLRADQGETRWKGWPGLPGCGLATPGVETASPLHLHCPETARVHSRVCPGVLPYTVIPGEREREREREREKKRERKREKVRRERERCLTLLYLSTSCRTAP